MVYMRRGTKLPLTKHKTVYIWFLFKWVICPELVEVSSSPKGEPLWIVAAHILP